MKNINFRIIALIFLMTALFSSCGLNRMIRGYGDGISYTPATNPLENHGGEVAVEVQGRVSERYFHPRAKVELTPVLQYEGGETVLNSIVLRGERTSGDGVQVNRRSSTNFTISDVVNYEDGMEASELIIRSRVYREGREGAATDLPDRKVADGVINTPQRVENDHELAIAPHGYEKVTTVSQSANIYFAYMRHDLNMRLPLNRDREAQNRLDELADFVRQGWEIESIQVNAWASPEGEVAFNEKLSANRANTTNTYVNNFFRRIEREQRTTIERPAVNVEAKGEDFEGFMEVLNASDIRDKQAIANVINSQLSPAERDRRIKDMTVIYAEIEELLQPLRRGEIVITAFEPKRTDEEIARLSTENPSELDVKELLYAATLTDDYQTKLTIYRNAQRVFAQDYRGFNNAAYVNLRLGNVEEAASDLEKANQLAPNSPEVLNNLGVVAAWQNDNANALSYFEAAQAQGARVNYNIGILMIKRGDYQAALSSFAGRTCTHNVALAHLLAGNESAAMTNLECARESAHVSYLKAVVGARRENNNMVYENLRRAVQQDPSLKQRAANDREFIRYYEAGEFQEVVR